MEGQVGARSCLRPGYIILVVLLSLANHLRSQDHYWWAENVNWDGVSHWSEYIVYSPRFMGPNALPIPSLSTGTVHDRSQISLTGNVHLATGDHTYNATIYANYVLVADRISFDLVHVPYEFFEVNHETKTARKVFHTFYNNTRAMGDLYFNTNVQLARSDRRQWALRLGYKFPTSTMQGAARFTNSPGYYLDLSYGQIWKSANYDILWFGMVGFYAWQTNSDEQFQNDALLMGTGLTFSITKWKLSQVVKGYFGYLGIGDQPVVAKTKVSFDLGAWILLSSVQFGLHDIPFTSLELGIGYQFMEDSNPDRK